MKNRTSVSHDDVMVMKLRQRPRFAAEYLKTAMEETDDPEVLLVALRHVAKAQARTSAWFFTPFYWRPATESA